MTDKSRNEDELIKANLQRMVAEVGEDIAGRLAITPAEIDVYVSGRRQRLRDRRRRWIALFALIVMVCGVAVLVLTNLGDF